MSDELLARAKELEELLIAYVRVHSSLKLKAKAQENVDTLRDLIAEIERLRAMIVAIASVDSD